ncbi:MAG: hypothetical protein HZC42_04155 [Candidatus Eisenbacteria bacterium]|nr:hypothetical protein [Candidatus Eisenbacteria bacterium]
MRLAPAFLLSGLVLLCAAPAGAQNVTTGLDFFVSIDPGSSQSFQGPYAIPADFFAPGSEPFTGTIQLMGDPLGTSPYCLDLLGPADTIVRRNADATLPGPPSTDFVPIEIVGLNLVSVNPIVVTYTDLHTEPWNVRVSLSPVPPATPGTIRIVLQTPQGGTFDSQLPVRPVFTFTRTSPPETKVLDPWGPVSSFFDVWVDVAVPWSYAGPPSLLDTSCDSNFRPTVQGGTLLVDRTLHGPYTTLLQHWPLSGATATRNSSWGALKTLYR